MQAPQRKPPPGVIFDSSLDESIDQVLALALLFGLEGKGQVRIASASTSRNNLRTAAFLDLLCRFYSGARGGGPGPNRLAMPVGMYADGAADAQSSPIAEAALARTAYDRGIEKLNDTAEPVALMRNALSAQNDRSAVVVLAGPPTNLLSLIALADGMQWVRRKARVLAIAAGRFDGQRDLLLKRNAEGFRKLLAEWPGDVVFAGAEFGEAVAFPGASLESSFAWAPNHPVVDAWHASSKAHGDAAAQAMAAALFAAPPDEGYFRLSAPGTVTVTEDGRAQFGPSADGLHRYLIPDPAQKTRVQEAYLKLASAPPLVPQRRGAPPAPAKDVAKALLIGALSLLALAPVKVAAQPRESFDQSVRPILTRTCGQCHNARLRSGGLDIAEISSTDSILANRETWQKILRRVRAGEMPPPGIARPPADRVDAFTSYVQSVFDRVDATAPAAPGHVTAHRLNRNEYTNTIRDLLGVDFRAGKYFPTDDSGDGFDNIGDVLTVSPVLMDRFMAAAERIAAWAISTDIPAKPIEALYHFRERKVRRIDRSTIEAEHRIDFGGEYVVRFGLPGERAKDAAPVKLGLWMDGKLLQTTSAETKPSGLVYFDPYSEEEMRLYLPEGDHVFRAGFIGDDFVRTLSDKDAYNRKVNKFLDSILFIGPFPSKAEKESRKKILICDPASGRACVERIVSTLARRAYRRPVTGAEVNGLLRFVDLAKQDGESAEQGIQLAIQAMLVSPNFLFHIERDAIKQSHPITGVELASRLSYFLWSSMPDDELLRLAETGKLRASLDAQVDRMLRDPRAAAFADNFAGQWLETRNLDVVKPDPDKFPDWDPELRDAMKRETSMFFESILRENRPISDFLTADYTFLNERLARHYGIDGVVGNDFIRVDLKPGVSRGGILSQASVLTVSSYPTRTSPVIRGKYVLQNILGTPPPPPPPDVPVLDEAAIGATMSMREQLQKHRADPTCAACHSKMDPLGFGLENYDAIGKWREKDGKFPVDASGVLPNGKTFSSPAEMRAILVSELPQFSRTLTAKMLTYALGRGLKTYDERTIDSIQRDLERNGYRFQTLIHQVVNSLPFQSARGESR